MPAPTNIKWVDRNQPQTLMAATVVLYINAVFLIIDGLLFGPWLLLIVGQVAAALGVANEKKWGYWLGVVTVGAFVAYLVWHFSPNFNLMITLLFYGALLALLLHPQSRSYRRVWFR